MIRKLILHSAMLCSVLLVASFSAGCSISGDRNPASKFLPPKLMGSDWVRASAQIAEDLGSPSFDLKTCKAYLKALSAELDSVDLSRITAAELPGEVSMTIQNRIKKNGPTVTQNFWRARENLHFRLMEINSACAPEVRKAFQGLRYVEEYLSEVASGAPNLQPEAIDFQKQPIPLAKSDPNYLFQRNRTGVTKFQPGDHFITRGVSFLSALIAQLGTMSSQFSHIVYLAHDPKGKALKTIESYVGVGVDFYPMGYALKNENARILWLRPKDQDLAKRASDWIADLVRKRIDSGDKIPYDYTLDFSNHDALSCAEVSRYAAEHASGGKFRVPEYPSSLKTSNQVVEMIGAKDGPTFSPGDLENDSRFTLEGDWRDLRLTRDSRLKDAVLAKIMQWMDKDGYRMQKTFNSRMTGPVWLSRKTWVWPLVQRALDLKDFSTQVPLPMLKTVGMVSAVGEVLLEEARKAEKAYEAKTKLPMTFAQAQAALEKFRAADLALYMNEETRDEAKLHCFFRKEVESSSRWRSFKHW